MNCTFCGHSNLSYNGIYIKLKLEIVRLIDKGVTTFYNGGYGNFDLTCLKAVSELNIEYPFIKNYIVLAYRDNIIIEKYDHICKQYHAETIYTLEQEIHHKYAITARNKWMVDSSDYMIAYVCNTYGGAYSNYKYARRKNCSIIEIINFADYINERD